VSSYHTGLVVPLAPLNDAPILAERAIRELVEQKLIRPTKTLDCVFGKAGGYPPGPRVSSLYEFFAGEHRYWDGKGINGVEVYSEPYINLWGSTIRSTLECPHCRCSFHSDHYLWSYLARAAGQFLQGNYEAKVDCVECHVANEARRWRTEPHLGFCFLAFEFWGWPPFSSDAWRIDIPKLISDAIGYEVAETCGRT